MRSYPRNSPQAAARIVALVLIADGHVCRSEVEALQELDASKELGLEPGALHGVLQALCEDLMMGAYARGSMMASIDASTLGLLMAEVDDPLLRLRVIRLAVAAAAADRHLAEAEDVVLSAASRHWGLKQPAGMPPKVLNEAAQTAASPPQTLGTAAAQASACRGDPTMLYALGWLVVAMLLALWSLFVWSAHGLGVWAASKADAISGVAANRSVAQLPEWLAPWIPTDAVHALAATGASLAPLLDGLAGGWTAVAWVGWAIGAALIVALGGLAHGLTAQWRRRGSPAMRRPGSLVPN